MLTTSQPHRAGRRRLVARWLRHHARARRWPLRRDTSDSTALLAFSGDWGLLAVLSSRWPDQPPQARGEERTTWATARHYGALRAEFAALPAALRQTRSVASLGD